VAGVVDVLAGAREVHELARGLQLGVAVEAALQPVLDRLHVVVGGALDLLDGLRVGLGEARTEPRSRPRAASDSGLNSAKPASDSAMNHSTSTCTRGA
jgi:hypothetical protein